MKKAKEKPHYVDNKKFLEAMTEFRLKVKTAEEKGKKRPMVTNYIGECFLKIANHLSYRPNFINYTFRDDMISDGIENCLQYMDNFNPEKSKNPFAYFTQIIYYAFLRRIQKEKKHLFVKFKMTEQTNLFDTTAAVQEHDTTKNFKDEIKVSEWTQQYMDEFITDFEKNKRRKIKKRKV